MVTSNQYALPFVCALRNGSYTDYVEMEDEESVSAKKSDEESVPDKKPDGPENKTGNKV